MILYDTSSQLSLLLKNLSVASILKRKKGSTGQIWNTGIVKVGGNFRCPQYEEEEERRKNCVLKYREASRVTVQIPLMLDLHPKKITAEVLYIPKIWVKPQNLVAKDYLFEFVKNLAIEICLV